MITEYIDYNGLIKHYKVNEFKKSTKQRSALESFSEDLASSFTTVSSWVSWFLFCEFNFKISIEDMQRIKKLKKLNYLLIKVMLYYHWRNTLKLVDQSNNFLNSLIIGYNYTRSKIPFFEFDYDVTMMLIPQYYLLKLNKIISLKDFEIYQDYYEQLYLQAKLYGSYYSEFYNMRINYSKYTSFLKGFEGVFVSLIKNLYRGFDKVGNYMVVDYCIIEDVEVDNKIRNFFIDIKSKLIEGWKIESKDLVKANYYEKNFKLLNELNAFIKKEAEMRNA